ncbi:AraC family transcriptional regulator [Peribacillus frigoritolerans]|uniref:AraC family transcriptional regulator n=1 Tax=Peribacillus frigoritolerans TaxID=450367 RepID=UPI0020BF70F8|nr:AraC family transcriptional regulator [Peribacillus frigoritolerans]
MSQQLIKSESAPFIHNAGIKHVKEGETFFKAMHNHPECAEILLILEGEGTYSIDGISYKVEPQSIVIYNQGVWHEERAVSNKPHKMLYAAFSNFKVEGLPDGHLVSKNVSPIAPIENFLLIEELFKELVKESESTDFESNWVARNLVGALLGLILRNIYKRGSTKKNSNKHKIIGEVKHYIQENYHQNITLEELAKISYISPYYLSHLFKELTGITPFQYLMQYRIEVSKHLLINSNSTINQISYQVGYQSETHFQNLFKKIVGVTPGKYRE